MVIIIPTFSVYPTSKALRTVQRTCFFQLYKADYDFRPVKICHWAMPLLPTLIHPMDKTGRQVSCKVRLALHGARVRGTKLRT